MLCSAGPSQGICPLSGSAPTPWWRWRASPFCQLSLCESTVLPELFYRGVLQFPGGEAGRKGSWTLCVPSGLGPGLLRTPNLDAPNPGSEPSLGGVQSTPSRCWARHPNQFSFAHTCLSGSVSLVPKHPTEQKQAAGGQSAWSGVSAWLCEPCDLGSPLAPGRISTVASHKAGCWPCIQL